MSNDPFESAYKPESGDEIPLSTGSVFSISSNELPFVIEKGNAGDSQSSFRLYQYFRFSKNNLDSSHEWLIKAAEQGHVTAQYNVAVSLLRDGNYSNALLWAEKAKVSGHDGANSLINEINGKLLEFNAEPPEQHK